MSGATPISGRVLARNTVLNAVGQTIPLLLALPILPYVLRGLGAERFAVLTLAWTVIGYFGFLDLGLGRAATRFIAGLLGAGRRGEVSRVVWTSLTIQAGLGTLGAVVIALLAPVIAADVLRIAEPQLLSETRFTLALVALGLPLVMLSGTYSGVLEAHQRFDLVNLVRVPANIATLAVPAVGVLLGWDLPAIVGGIVAARATGLLAFALLANRTSGGLRPVRPHGATLRQLLAFGGWLTVSLLAVPILTYAERLLIGGLRSLTELAYYAVPFEVIARTAVVPSALAFALFPAFSQAQSGGGRVSHLFLRPARLLFILEWPLLVIFWLFPGEILNAWMGESVAAAGANALRLLAVAFFFNAFAQIALAGVQGLGRADLKAKLDLVQVPLYVGVAALLIMKWGITGAAAAKLIFTITDTVLLFAFARRLGAPPLLAAGVVRRRPVLTTFTLVIAFVVAAAVVAGPAVRLLCGVTAIALVSAASWSYLLEPADRTAIRALLSRRRTGEAAT